MPPVPKPKAESLPASERDPDADSLDARAQPLQNLSGAWPREVLPHLRGRLRACDIEDVEHHFGANPVSANRFCRPDVEHVDVGIPMVVHISSLQKPSLLVSVERHRISLTSEQIERRVDAPRFIRSELIGAVHLV